MASPIDCEFPLGTDTVDRGWDCSDHPGTDLSMHRARIESSPRVRMEARSTVPFINARREAEYTNSAAATSAALTDMAFSWRENVRPSKCWSA